MVEKSAYNIHHIIQVVLFDHFNVSVLILLFSVRGLNVFISLLPVCLKV